jgi:prevent-host-death family protein
MNTLTASEIKRRGMPAIEEALQNGPVHIVKHDRPAAVVISARAFERLTADAALRVHLSVGLDEQGRANLSAFDYLLSLPSGTRAPMEILEQIAEEQAAWGGRAGASNER